MSPDKPIDILLIDDDEDDRDFFKIAVSDIEFNIRCKMAADAKEGLAMLRQGTVLPDFIFLDLNMPGINGRTCLKQLKSDPATAAIPVVIFSTSSEQQDILETKALGATHFMTKPPDISELSGRLNNFFNQQIQNL